MCFEDMRCEVCGEEAFVLDLDYRCYRCSQPKETVKRADNRLVGFAAGHRQLKVKGPKGGTE